MASPLAEQHCSSGHGKLPKEEGEAEQHVQRQGKGSSPPPATRPVSAMEPSQQMPTLELLFWVAVAAAQPVCVSMIGVLVRYLEVEATPPVPPLRVTCLIVIFALPVMLLVHVLPLVLAPWCRQRQQQQQRRRIQGAGGRAKNAASAGYSQDAGFTEERGPAHLRSTAAGRQGGGTSSGSLAAGEEEEEMEERNLPPPGKEEEDEELEEGQVPPSRKEKEGEEVEEGGVLPATHDDRVLPATHNNRVPRAAAVAGLARVPTLPGLSRVYDRHPMVHRRLVLLVVSGCYLGVIVLLNVAPKLLDPAVIMLVTMFTVVGVALVGRLALGVPLPRSLPPAAILMIGGSAMVLVPDIKDGAGKEGSLTTLDAWLGFVASVGALCLTILFIVLTQAFKHANLGAMEVLWWIAGLTFVFVLPVSLGVEGADWGEQFRGFDAGAWGALLFSACVGHVGAGPLLQYATWKLGGNTASLFFGLRLIVSVVASKVILGATIISSGLQVAGAVLVVVSITCYMVVQWWAGRTRQLQAAAHQLKSIRCAA